MSGHDELNQTSLARFREGIHIVFEHGLEWLLVRPFRMLIGQRLHPIQCKGKLHIHRLLAPQRAVVVEGRDALRRRDKIRRAFAANRSDEAQDRLLGRTIVP
jgi:hypothetical protein